ncbi:SRPBCC family protein [Streptomonospora litoralis]|uniref:SRPBCC family protein n=1 Tax=Streptomonospora litoralis TaxID=2498135 RepID=A0A4P6Q1F8_9ACTN|nr:SRPBCC family protein [Streptomonospora litoralis]QBI54323.1 hypothetical protein EKD16_12705 [Streptomonospora litoralis]
MSLSLYIETAIAADLETVWRRTRDAELHRRWDLRFTGIADLDGEREEAQRFTYTTRLLPGVALTGTGATTAERTRADGTRISALRFGSAHALSPIAHGAGHWRYTPRAGGVEFATAYHYRTRWGRAGRMLDAALLAPLMGWATAWSFDRLRLWCERGDSPERLRTAALCDAGARAAAVAAGLVWLPGWAGAAVVAAALLLPPPPMVPAARRCRRRPRPRGGTGAPAPAATGGGGR